MKAKILAALRETEGYVSGQELCERFGVSRTAVWKAINQLKKDGYEIEAVQNRGYRIVGAPDILSENELSSIRKTDWIGKKIYYYDETDSTNVRAAVWRKRVQNMEPLWWQTSRMPEREDVEEAGVPCREPESL